MITNLENPFDSYGILSETFLNSKIPMFWCDEKRFVILNRAFVKLTGFSKDQLFEKGYDDLGHPDFSQEKLQDIFQISEKREFKNFTWVLRNGKNEPLSLEIRLARFFTSYDRMYYFGLVKGHISQELQSGLFEDDSLRLKMALNASKQGMWEWNLAEDDTSYSNEYYQILGYKPKSFPANFDSWVALLHPDDTDRAIATWEYFSQSGESSYQDEFRMLKADKSYLWVETEGRVVQRDTNNKPLRVLGTVRDINLRKLNELKIKDQSQKLIDYAFFNSHRLRGPLSSILGLAEMLKAEYNPKAAGLLQKVAKELDGVITEINHILIGDSAEYQPSQNAPIKKVSLVDKNRILHVVYKKTFEKYLSDVELTSLDRAREVLRLLKNKTLSTDLLLLDIDSAFDIWKFLSEYEKLYSDIPIYLLAKNVELADAMRASTFSCVKGFLLKPVTNKVIIDLVSNASHGN